VFNQGPIPILNLDLLSRDKREAQGEFIQIEYDLFIFIFADTLPHAEPKAKTNSLRNLFQNAHPEPAPKQRTRRGLLFFSVLFIFFIKKYFILKIITDSPAHPEPEPHGRRSGMCV
jgi:hypothetical protein